MNAQSIIKRHGGKWFFKNGSMRCPAHDDKRPSLMVWDTDNDIGVKCFAGCTDNVETWKNIKDILKGSGSPFIQNIVSENEKSIRTEAKRSEEARALWRQARPIINTPGETYLHSRHIEDPIPESLRYHPKVFHSESKSSYPAILQAVCRYPDKKPVAVQRVFIKPDGTAKAPVEPNKKMLGPVRGGAVRLGKIDDKLLVGEGVESALSAQQIFGIPAWAALSASNFKTLNLPAHIGDIWIARDNDAAGIKAATAAADRWTYEGKTVRILEPATPNGDFNDDLLQMEKKPCRV